MSEFNEEEYSDKPTYECLSDSDKALDVEFVFTQIQDFQRPIPFENLR